MTARLRDGLVRQLTVRDRALPTSSPGRELEPRVRLVHSTRLARLTDGPERAAAVIADAGIDAVNLHYTDWNGGLVALFHRFERIAFGWDLQYDHVLHPAVRMGLDGV